MKLPLDIDTFLQARDNCFVVDVRSPGEYSPASIPGAVNVPLFDAHERGIVGTTYRQEGTDRAKLVGLSIVAPKLPHLVDSILKGAAGKEIVLYCWRGGMRSRSLAGVFEILGYRANYLAGGYKAFRRHVVKWLKTVSLDMPVFVLNGLTGVGKTLVIRELQAMGAPALDLEAMANHRGSVFGAVGLGGTSSQKDFESRLYLSLRRLSGAPFLVAEGEGKRIGPVLVPDFLYTAMRESPHILLEAPLDVRAARIVAEYSGQDTQTALALAEAVQSLEQRLGTARCRELAACIRRGNFETAAKALCGEYYDRYYRDSRRDLTDYIAVVDVTDISAGARRVLAVIEEHLNCGES